MTLFDFAPPAPPVRPCEPDALAPGCDAPSAYQRAVPGPRGRCPWLEGRTHLQQQAHLKSAKAAAKRQAKADRQAALEADNDARVKQGPRAPFVPGGDPEPWLLTDRQRANRQRKLAGYRKQLLRWQRWMDAGCEGRLVYAPDCKAWAQVERELEADTWARRILS